MPTWVFAKRVGAPSGSIGLEIGQKTYTIDDAGNSTITVTDASEASELQRHSYLVIQGVSGTFSAPLTAFQQKLLGWVLSQAFILTSASRDANGTITTGAIVWPDGGTGVITTDTASVAFVGAVDAYHATYSGPGGTMTITQPAVTRDANGGVTVQPSPVFS
jgi:type II secretory pathway component HofQ